MSGKKDGIESGSLDILLDTMCNTFGGVCFIALMVCLILAMTPKGDSNDHIVEEVEEEETMLFDHEKAELLKEIDELNAIIKTKEEFLEENTNKLAVVRMDVSNLVSNTAEIARLKRRRLELEDELAKITTESEYSKREAARLERLLKSLEESLENPVYAKKRMVRTPIEREVPNARPIDVMLHKGYFYVLEDKSQVDVHEYTEDDGRKVWEYTMKEGKGILVTEAFIAGNREYHKVMNRLEGTYYLRIYSDGASFPGLCMIRDDLVKKRKMYNWHINEGKTISFVQGADRNVQ